MADMAEDFDDLLGANREAATRRTGPRLPGRAARGLAVVTCMDSRIDPLRMLSLAEGDAYILRNAGGRVSHDVLSALVLAVHLLDVRRIMVVAHTSCRMGQPSDDALHAAIADASGMDTRSLDFGAVPDQEDALRHDVQRIRSSPHLSTELSVIGCRYDLDTGLLDVLVTR